MAGTYCPINSGDPAVEFAAGGYSTFMGLAPQTFEQAVALTNAIGDILVNPVDFQVSFDFDGQLTPFQRPIKPTLDPSRFEFNKPADPAAPPAFSPGNVIMDAMPVFSVADPVLQYGTRPNEPNVPVPAAPGPQADLVMPAVPTYTLPPLPTLSDLNLPSVPNIVLPEFEGQRPVFVEPPLADNWSFSTTEYVSQFLDQVKAKVSSMMDGNSGLGPIEDALFARARERIDIEVRRDIETRTDEFATRGFSEPNGVLAASLDEILQSGQFRKAELNRDIAIESYKESLVNLRFAVQQGVALEQLLSNLHIQEQQLALSAAQFARETAIAILNARVTVFNARLQAYQTDATVMRARIDAELAKVEVFRAQIEGEKARGEINAQRVQIYAEQVRSLAVLADFYTAQVNGVRAQAEVQRNIIDRFKAEVDAYSARWKAYGDQVEAYKAGIEAENGRVTVHSNLIKAYADRVNATNLINRGKIDAENLRIQQHGQQVQVFDAAIRRLLALIQGEQARVQGESARADALARIYTAEAGVETAASAAADRSLQIGLERARAQTDVGLEQARIAVQQNVSLTQTSLEKIKSQAQVLAQLAASALSAMNFSASVSSGRSQSTGCSTSFNWSGEVPDYE